MLWKFAESWRSWVWLVWLNWASLAERSWVWVARRAWPPSTWRVYGRIPLEFAGTYFACSIWRVNCGLGVDTSGGRETPPEWKLLFPLTFLHRCLFASLFVHVDFQREFVCEGRRSREQLAGLREAHHLGLVPLQAHISYTEISHTWYREYHFRQFYSRIKQFLLSFSRDTHRLVKTKPNFYLSSSKRQDTYMIRNSKLDAGSGSAFQMFP